MYVYAGTPPMSGSLMRVAWIGLITFSRHHAKKDRSRLLLRVVACGRRRDAARSSMAALCAECDEA